MNFVNGASGTGSKHKRKVVGVALLGGEELIVHVDIKGKFYEVFNQVTAHLNLRETEYFGLALLRDEEYQFLVLDEKISKTAPKRWKTSPGEGWDSNGSTPLFKLKENVLKYDHLYNEEKCFQIVGFALQADFGNFIADKHIAGYFDPRLYFPAWMLEKRGVEYLSKNCPMVHGDLHNMTRTDAELKYVRECSSPPGAHNMHFYRACKKKTDKVCNIWLAICYRGIEVYEDDAGYKNLISTFLWQDIGRIVFDKKKFEIRSAESAGGRRFAYYTENDGISKYLLNFCRSIHLFQMAIQPKLMEIRHLDAEDKKRYKESYIYSDARDLHANGGPVRHRSGRSPGKCAVGTQRYSAVSDASSNATSGIFSDRMALSFDEGEETGREIIIDCPPKQRSLQETSGHSHPKMPLRNNHKMTSPASSGRSPALPCQSLELFPSSGSSGKGSPASPHLQQLTPAGSSASYRAKFQHGSYTAAGKVFSMSLTPSPSSSGKAYSLTNRSPSSPPEEELSSLEKSVSCHDNFKGMQGAVQTGIEMRVMSGDSTATSGSTASTDTVALSVENSPVAPSAGRAQVGQQPNTSASRSPSFSYSPTCVSQVLPTTVLGNSVIHPPEQLPALQAGCIMFPNLTSRLEIFGSSPPAHQFSSRVLPPAPASEHIYTDTGNSATVEEMQEVLPSPTRLAEGAKAKEMTNGGALLAGVLHGHPSQAAHSVGVDSSNSATVCQGVPVDSESQALVDGNNGTHHSAQSSEEDPGTKDSCADSTMPRKSTGGKRNTSANMKAGNRSKATHVSVKNQKEALHPDIEQILGQSQAHSLPFIMALCNDLMTRSTHSSTGSYDASTRRSSDSHPDSRRWSTCGPVEIGVSTEQNSGLERYIASAGTGARPYSWHSEHFDLDTSLTPVSLSRAGPCVSPPFHQPQLMTENHRSFPQELCSASSAGHPVLWTQDVANSGSGVPCGRSVDRYSPELIAQHLMIPSRLSSGGHSMVEGGNISPHKTLKENIGVA